MKKGARRPLGRWISPKSVSCTTIVGSAGHAITGTFAAAVIAHLALLELARISAVALLLFLLEVSALGHAELMGSVELSPTYSMAWMS